MAWELEIVHIDLIGSGDATLLIARDRDATGAVLSSRSMLVDGGHVGQAWRVRQVIETGSGLDSLDVIVTTHYDSDHCGGITALMRLPDPGYQHCRIYDQGEASVVPTHPSIFGDFGARETDYYNYATAVATQPNRQRVTEKVCSLQHPDTGQTRRGWQPPDWLVGQELLWQGAPVAPSPGAPHVYCVAANQYVLRPNRSKQYCPSSVLQHDNSNAKSLALLVTFGNFMYYLGGDLESPQEDALIPVLHRLDAFKTSHHGSHFSTSAAFLSGLQPRVAMISCGTNNQHGHPDPATTLRLDHNRSVEEYYQTGEMSGRPPGAKAVICGVRSFAAGRFDIYEYGDVRLSVTQAEAGHAPPQFRVIFARPDAGNNPQDGGAFACLPWRHWVWSY